MANKAHKPTIVAHMVALKYRINTIEEYWHSRRLPGHVAEDISAFPEGIEHNTRPKKTDTGVPLDPSQRSW